MQTPAQFIFDRLNLPLDTFLHGLTTYLKPAFPCLCAIVSKTQKVKCFRFFLTSRATFFCRIATKTDYSGFIGWSVNPNLRILNINTLSTKILFIRVVTFY
jgi:hypothetical protein